MGPIQPVWDPVVWVSGICQTTLFFPFFYYYIQRFVLVYRGGGVQTYAPIRSFDSDEEDTGADTSGIAAMAPGGDELEAGQQHLPMVELHKEGGREVDDEWAAAAAARLPK